MTLNMARERICGMSSNLGRERMAKVVDNKDAIQENLSTFNDYKTGSEQEAKFYKRGLRNCSFFVAERLGGDRYRFTPANFAGYKNANIDSYSDNSLYPAIKRAISRVLKTQDCENGEIDAAFRECCRQCGSEKVTPRKKPLRYWMIDNQNIDGAQGERDGKASRLGLGGPAESAEHRRLKEYVADNPAIIDMVNKGKTEHKFESGDEAEVYFGDPHKQCVVEVKSYVSLDTDLKRGIYQCVKYRALGKAEREAKEESIDAVETVLVIQRQLPTDLERLARMFKIRVLVVDRADVPLGEESPQQA
jgi:hypothetical protein